MRQLYIAVVAKTPGLCGAHGTVTAKAGKAAFLEPIRNSLGETNTRTHARYPLRHKS